MRRIIFTHVFLYLFYFPPLCILPQSTLLAEEIISNYKVSIIVNKDSSLDITEEIRVKAEGRKIKRGIYRDFPTKYRSKNSTKYNVGFKVLSVKRNGIKEKYRVKNKSNGVRIYIGEKSKFIEHDWHVYTLRFRTTRQLGYFESYDELYFNAIGHGWDFAIENAEVSIQLPDGISANEISHEAYTGRKNSVERFYSSYIIGSNKIKYTITRKLNAREGFTIVANWPKGKVHEPSTLENYLSILQDNVTGILALLLGVVSMFVSYIFWMIKGKDPERGVAYPRFKAPERLKPYDIPYLTHMGYKDTCLSSVLITAAINGDIEIVEEPIYYGLSTETKLIQKSENKKSALSTFEKEILTLLFLGDDTVECKSKNYKRFQYVVKRLKKECKRNLKGLFSVNLQYAFPGLILSILGAILAFVNSYVALGVSIGILGLIAFGVTVYLMRRYTEEGVVLMDEITGYKMYLETAEQEYFEDLKYPELTEDQFEEHLPYAVALGVGGSWVNAFAAALRRAGMDPDSYNPSYHTTQDKWHSSNFYSSGSGGFSSKIASSSSAPGSSSGSGGGSSGGGGGGGGGGGW